MAARYTGWAPTAKGPGARGLFPFSELGYPARMFACHFCGAPVDDPRAVYRDSTCPSCRRDLKVCMNCRHYSPGAHWDCAETIDEQVTDKERRTFCTSFSFRAGAPAAGQAARRTAAAGEARKKLDALFGNGS